MAGFISILIGILLVYVALSNKGGLVADFVVKLFSTTKPPAE